MVQASASANSALSTSAVEPMTAAPGPEGAEDGRAGQSEVADRIERLVAHELVGEAQAFAIDDAVVADGDGVVQRGAESQAGGPQALHILHEAEGAGPGQFAAEGAGVEIDLDPLAADQRRVEIDLDVEMETVMRGELAMGAGIFHRLQSSRTLR